MKYIVLPAEILAEVTQETLDYFHLSPRYSIDGTEVIMKLDNYYKLFPQVNTLDEESEPILPPFPIYTNGTNELDTLLSSSAWTINTEENDI